MTRAKASAAAGLSALFLFLLAPAALAQGVPNVGDVGGTIGDTTGGATDTIQDTTGGASETIQDTTGGATETIQDTTQDTTNTVGGTTGGATGGATNTIEDTTKDTTGTVGETTGGATNTIQDTTKDTTDTVNGTTGGVTGPVKDTVGGVTGGNGSGPVGGGAGGLNIPPVDDLAPGVITEILDEAETLGLSPEASKGWIEGKKILETASFDNSRAALSSFSRLLESVVGTIAESGTGAGSPNVTLTVEEPDGESFAESAGRIATEAAKTLAFPLALALAVGGFLMVQGRIGRKDPKLALAPVDTTEESLIFE